MTTSTVDARVVLATGVHVTQDQLEVTLDDGRRLAVPVAWYSRLADGTAHDRARWRLIGKGEGIHWPDLDEDISVEDLLAGRRSGESAVSLRRWRAARRGQ